MRASELIALLNRLDEGIPSDVGGLRVTGIDEALTTIDMVLDSIPGARAFIESHAEQIFLAGPGGDFSFEDIELSQPE